jgi:eukaryotic-like serine/threonine-protein kinase
MATRDNNLLFAILALQLDFIDSNQLVQAANAWMLSKEIPIGQLFVDRKFLTADDRAFIDKIVEKHVKRSGSVENSLRDLTKHASATELKRGLEDSGMADELISGLIEPALRAGNLESTQTIPRSLKSNARFRILRDLNRGGLGKISVARDEELDRDVVIKEILGKLATNDNAKARFIAEAKVTGSLDHPGVVPIFAMGEFEDKRPYYAMRLIRGQSMQEAIDDFHSKQHTSYTYSIAIRFLVRHVIDVCDTMGYAHSRGVLHRDLKPTNIMLGKYGETLVVDWGLAKTLDSSLCSAMHSELPVFEIVSSDSQPTAIGSVLGTPGFMSPEQATGRLDLMDHRSDIFSLGAMLYAVLVGRAPFTGTMRDEVVAKARENRFDPPRSVNRNIPKELNAICLKAMSLKREERYESSLTLGEDLDRWIAGEPVGAAPEGITMKTLRWTRRHQSAVVSGFILCVCAIVGLLSYNRAVSTQRDIARTERDNATVQRQIADLATDRAQKSSVTSSKILLEFVTEIANERWAQLPGMDSERLDMITKAADRFYGLLGDFPEDQKLRTDTVQALVLTANALRTMGKRTEASIQYERAIALLEDTSIDKSGADSDFILSDILYYHASNVKAISGIPVALPIAKRNTDFSAKYLQSHPGEFMATIAAARAKLQLADFAYDISDRPTAILQAAEAEKLLTSIAQGNTETLAWLLYRIDCGLARGRTLVDMKDFEIARRCLDEAMQYAVKMRDTEINRRDATLYTARIQIEIARLMKDRNERDESRNQIMQAMVTMRSMVETYSQSSNYPYFLVVVCSRATIDFTDVSQEDSEKFLEEGNQIFELAKAKNLSPEKILIAAIELARAEVALQQAKNDLLAIGKATLQLDSALTEMKRYNSKHPVLD